MAVGLATATAIGVIGLGAATATSQALAGREQSKGLKQAGEFNALVYEQQASMVENQKKLEEMQYNRAASKIRGAVTARTAGAGFELSGSPLAILVDNETQLELDKSVGQYNLEVQKRFALSGAQYSRQSSADQARLAKFQGYTNAFSTLLGTAGTAAILKAPKVGKL